MVDKIKVKPLRTFDLCDGSGVKTDQSPVFEVERGTASELRANGLVEFVTDEAKPKRKARANEDE